MSYLHQYRETWKIISEVCLKSILWRIEVLFAMVGHDGPGWNTLQLEKVGQHFHVLPSI